MPPSMKIQPVTSGIMTEHICREFSHVTSFTHKEGNYVITNQM